VRKMVGKNKPEVKKLDPLPDAPEAVQATETEQTSSVQLTEITKETELGYTLPDGSVVTKEKYLEWLGNLMWEIHKAVA